MKFIWADLLLAQSCTALAAVLVYTAHLYNTTSIGINPWIALPIASLLMLLPFLFASEHNTKE